VIYKRGKAYWYNFRWTITNAEGTKESFRIVKSARAKNRDDAKDAEDEHRRALRLGQIHPRDPWPQPAASAPPIFRVFSKEFLQYARTHTKPGTVTFYEGCLDRLLTFAAIADAPIDAITGEQASRYARHRGEVAKNSIVTVNGDLRTLRRVLKVAVEWFPLTCCQRSPLTSLQSAPVVPATADAPVIPPHDSEPEDGRVLSVPGSATARLILVLPPNTAPIDPPELPRVESPITRCRARKTCSGNEYAHWGRSRKYLRCRSRASASTAPSHLCSRSRKP